ASGMRFEAWSQRITNGPLPSGFSATTRLRPKSFICPPHSDPRMEVMLQDGLERHSYNTPNRFDETIDRYPQVAGILRFCTSPGPGSRGATVINVLRVVGGTPPVGWPHSGLRIEGDWQFDGASVPAVPAVRQPGRLAVVARISDAPGQRLQRLGHVAAS